MRYLGGILEFPTFWEEDSYEIHKLTAIKLLQKLSSSTKEIGVDSGLRYDEEKGEDESFSDTEGLELIIGSMLLGVKVWLGRINEAEIDSQEWFEHFQTLLELLIRFLCSFNIFTCQSISNRS
jgi:hypothetical protein